MKLLLLAMDLNMLVLERLQTLKLEGKVIVARHEHPGLLLAALPPLVVGVDCSVVQQEAARSMIAMRGQDQYFTKVLVLWILSSLMPPLLSGVL